MSYDEWYGDDTDYEDIVHIEGYASQYDDYDTMNDVDDPYPTEEEDEDE